jgi:hypothetical protein
MEGAVEFGGPGSSMVGAEREVVAISPAGSEVAPCFLESFVQPILLCCAGKNNQTGENEFGQRLQGNMQML